MTRPAQKVVSKKFAKIIQDPRFAGRMEPMAPIIDLHSCDFETARISADVVPLLQYSYVRLTLLDELPGRPHACRSSTEYDYPRSCHLKNERNKTLRTPTISLIAGQRIDEHFLFLHCLHHHDRG